MDASGNGARSEIAPIASIGWRAWFGLALVLALTAWTYRDTHELGFTGADALADVAAARVDGPADVARQAWMPLTAGIAGVNANFWRPVTMLHYALLRGLFGWNAAGWHVWDLGLHLAVVTLLFLLVHTAVRKHAATSALLAAALLALHPLGVELVPAVARNLDLLFTLFSVATLLAVSRGNVVAAAVLGVLAIGAKEAAVVVLPVAVLWMFAVRGRRAAIQLAAAYALALPLYLFGRTAVLDGWGGYNRSGPTFFVSQLDETLAAAPLEVLFPGWSGAIEAWVPRALGLPLGALILVAAVFLAARAWRRGARLPAVGVALFVLPLVLYGLTGLYTRRLLYLPAVGSVLAASALATGRPARIVVALWVLTLLPASPIVSPDQDWRRNDDVTRGLTDAIADDWKTLPGDATVWIMDRPFQIDGDPHRRSLWRGGKSVNNTLAHYSLRAWVEARLGRDDLELLQVSRTEHVRELGQPRVSVEGEWLRVMRPPLERVFGERNGWELRAAGDDALVRREGAGPNEYLLVAGTPRSILVALPLPLDAPR